MIPFNKGSHLSTLRGGREREQAGRCISCFYLNGNFNGSRTFPLMLAVVQRWLLKGYLAVQWELVSPHRRCCRSLELLQGFCLAYLFLCSLWMTFMQMGLTAPSLLSVLTALSAVETQLASGESACTFFRGQLSCTGRIEWMRIMSVLYAECMYLEIQSLYMMSLLTCINVQGLIDKSVA